MIKILIFWLMSILSGALAASIYSFFVLNIEPIYLPGVFGICSMYLLIYSSILLLPIFIFAFVQIETALLSLAILAAFIAWAIWIRSEILFSFADGDDSLSLGYLVMIVTAIGFGITARFSLNVSRGRQ